MTSLCKVSRPWVSQHLIRAMMVSVFADQINQDFGTFTADFQIINAYSDLITCLNVIFTSYYPIDIFLDEL